ncbi:RHS repeat-associated core domain-containing protein [Nocardioides sp.]|uniref:RHS repeat-associated core domain-containing protein n=1 Tax=Nocardioides sp. TaxID=35761 RepID=UPI00198A5632|nr:RHS repeat-associated core domain-containing protein [Nocardioides sp.]MBC7278236.1 hypothetical protein [Nocardioides sp.]
MSALVGVNAPDLGRFATCSVASVSREETLGEAEYVYTGAGERIIRADAEAVTIYLPGGQEVTIPRDETRNVSAHRYYTFNGETVAVRDERGLGGVTSLVNDHHGTPIVSIPNTTWTQVSVAKHYSDPFGAARGARRAATDQDRDANGSPGDRGFLGKSNDTTGLTQVGARYYDSTTGAFVSPDPVLDPSEPRHLNAYVYSYQNPTPHSDPTGLKTDLMGGGGRGGYSGCSSACTRPWREVLFGPSKAKPKPVVPRAPSSVDRARDAAMAARGSAAAAARAEERANINTAKDQAAISRANTRYAKNKRDRDDSDEPSMVLGHKEHSEALARQIGGYTFNHPRYAEFIDMSAASRSRCGCMRSRVSCARMER